MSDILDAALAYAARGWRVFPCKLGDKTPLTEHGCLDATDDPLDISWWWGEQFPDANVAIATGSASGIVVLDIDGEHEGYESIGELVERYKVVPRVPVVLTGGGGEHWYFKAPLGPVQNKTGVGRWPGLDVRGEGGYVIAPPSVHPNGKVYEWSAEAHADDVPPPAIPDWLLRLFAERPRKGLPGGVIKNGSRSDTLARIAGMMRRYGLSGAAIEAGLQVDNQERCVPPLDEDEIHKIAHGMERYAPVAQRERAAMVGLPDG